MSVFWCHSVLYVIIAIALPRNGFGGQRGISGDKVEWSRFLQTECPWRHTTKRQSSATNQRTITRYTSSFLDSQMTPAGVDVILQYHYLPSMCVYRPKHTAQ